MKNQSLVQAHTMPVTRTGHYYTFGNANKNTKYLWLATHGYGQLAKTFIHKFDQLDAKKHFVVAPEGLSKFYWKRPQVGASWMTKEDRLDEIEDYTNWIKSVYDKFVGQCSEEVTIVLFGFSQGVATQYRWITKAFPKFDHLVMWAGLVPEDLDYRPWKDYFSDKQIHMFVGNQDQFNIAERRAWHEGFAKENELSWSYQEFEGKHEIPRAVLADFVKRLENGKL